MFASSRRYPSPGFFLAFVMSNLSESRSLRLDVTLDAFPSRRIVDAMLTVCYIYEVPVASPNTRILSSIRKNNMDDISERDSTQRSAAVLP